MKYGPLVIAKVSLKFGDGPDVPVQPAIGHPVVRACGLAADLGRCVGRPVVRDEQPEVRVVLGEEGVERVAQVSLAVVGGQADADAWLVDVDTSARRPGDLTTWPVVIMPG